MSCLRKICIALVVALLFLIPVQAVNAATNADTLKNLFDKVDNQSKWKASSNKPDGYQICYTDSYVMRAYLLMYQSTGDKKYLNSFTSFADSVLARRDNVVGKTDFRGLRLPGWSSNHFDPKQNMHYVMATGMIATPLAQFATVVKSDPALASYNAKANIYLQAARDAVAIHEKPGDSRYIYSDNNWIEDGNAMYLKRPLNMSLAYGSALLAIYEATGDKSYLDRGTKIANYFKQQLTVNPATNGYYWKYFPGHPSYGNVIEDLSHSTLGTEFAYLSYKCGLFNNNDMQRFANTATKTLARSNGSVAERLNGSGTSTQPGKFLHWLWFEPWAPSLLDTSYNIVKNRTSTYPMELIGIAMLNYFNAHGETPDPVDPAPGPGPGEPEPEEPEPPQDTQRPVVKVNAPATGSQLKGTAVFQVSASDNTGVDKLVLGYGPSAKGPWTEFKGTAELKSGSATEGNWELSWDVSGLADGTYYVLARATDAAGNMVFSPAAAYEVKNAVPEPEPEEPEPPQDTQRPVVKVNAPATGSQLKGTAVFQVSASDNTGVDKLVLGYGPSAKGPWTEFKGTAELKSGSATEGNWELSWDVSGLADGTYYVLARATDAAGNMGFSPAAKYEVKNKVENPAPAGNLIQNGDFSAGLQGWSNKNNSAKISRDSAGNPALTNTSNYDFFQEISLKPGNYKLNARTHAGNSKKAAMIVVVYYYRDGSHSTEYAFKHQHAGRTWESMREMAIKVPSTVVKARVFLTVEPGDNGYHHFDDVTLTAVK
ncbi:Ig-like domain-containing protein [Desulfallas thermosapovorans]|uniref:Ig-like domain-containing protein n=1 Tax=Desulfallas thermosapovorans DSM 6562 TaxID=1121431 RepID=A0A5S4ZUS0_9FIRM|nr:Ig-like domain-containing protein [Desulfallas thermosapovorans]TYO96451.1 hypothetical protein LX24_00918 [Desulfallas thermosapovorans DSM 6562]